MHENKKSVGFTPYDKSQGFSPTLFNKNISQRKIRMSYTNTELSEAIREAIERCRESNKVESNLQCRNCTEQARYKLKQNNQPAISARIIMG